MFAPITSLILVSILVALGVLHLLWALGSSFPCANEQALARAVVGRRGITKMPSSLCPTIKRVLCKSEVAT